MAEINYINGYEIADAQARSSSLNAISKATEALTKTNNNTASILSMEAEISALIISK